ncbi:protein unc-45 homolog B [Lepeophtheirus salmonis]|uniref:protein unc-45 homolog B n=1 Tax=Lepeophtheirus salmonis TaxID=72036 RepID=UPI001AE8D3FD|nr:protein unc-45 homolog B-like [Lepeophtheirus salmonis]
MVDQIDSLNKLTELKDAGNEAYKLGDLVGAISLYEKGIKAYNQKEDKDSDLAAIYKNLAAVYVKKEDWEAVVKQASKCLEITPNDPKALFRRCQAYETLNNIELAYKDARDVHNVDKTNKTIQPILERLHKAVSLKVSSLSQTTNKVKNMFEIVFDPSNETEKREKAADNLIVLAREKGGSEILEKENVVERIVRAMKVEKNKSIRLSLIRCLNEFSKENVDRCRQVIKLAGIPFFLDIVNTHESEIVTAASYTLQVMLDALSNAKLQKTINEKKKNKRNMTSDERKWCRNKEEERQALIKENAKELNSIMHVVSYNVTSRILSGEARDGLIELIMKNGKYDELNWAYKFLNTDAIGRLMEVSSQMTEYKHESAMEITDNTRNIVGATIGILYDQMYDDKSRNIFISKIEEFMKEKLLEQSTESKVRAVVAITTLLNNAHELGQAQIAKEGILQMMLAMAQSEDSFQQMVAAEAIISSASKKKDTNIIITQGIDILKTLYKSKNDHIKVRALVGLCKLGASSGHDASLRPFSDGSSTKLAEACRRFLVNPGKDRDLRKWAVEGLSYLSLDAEVKERLCEDESALRSLVDLAKQGKQDCCYGVVTLLVNLTNSFDKADINPELLQLAKFAKHHIPQEHELDDEDFVDKRIFTLANIGITSALVALCKTESQNLKELICRVLNAICKHQDLRGYVVQQGGSKTLVTMALEGTEKGKRQAAQALARIGITQDPSIAFPGQRSVDVIRPIMQLLNSEYDGIENFEALMCLCNIASMNESVRSRILKESDFICAIENFMFEDHALIRRAAVQCWTNLCTSPLMVKRCEGKNDKVKYCVLLCGDDDDIEIVKAASGALAMLTSQSSILCHKVFDSIQWLDCLLNLLANADFQIVLRGAVVVRNIVTAENKEDAEKVMNSQIMDVLQALVFKANLDSGSYQPDPILQQIKEIADESLNIAHKMKIIKTQEEMANEPDSD